nr:FecR family protein [Prolixibacteraceae bacterium]
MKKHYEQYTSDDFVNDESFVDWVVNPDKEDVSFWQKYCTKHTEQELAIKKAIRFIHSMKAQESDIDPRRFEVMWQNILSQQKNKQHKIRIRRWLSAVAAVFVLAIATYAYFSINKPLIIDSEELAVVDTESIHVVLGDGSVKTLLGENSKISQESDGTLVVNSDTIKSIQDQTIKVAMNKLVVPYGKRTDLYLSDGTHIYVNSGSKLEFPSVFKGNKREIFLEGEAFCEVVADQEHPFIIHTPDIDVRVTGTVFNVQAYRNEEHSHTVLVKGQVTLINQRGLLKDKMIVRPGEKVLFNKETGDFS